MLKCIFGTDRYAVLGKVICQNPLYIVKFKVFPYLSFIFLTCGQEASLTLKNSVNSKLFTTIILRTHFSST